MDINTLPDDALRFILQRCHLTELLHLRVVCRRWLSLIESLFFDNKATLKIFGSTFDIGRFASLTENHRLNKHIDICLVGSGPVDDVLVLRPEGGEAACTTIPLLFPNITKLLLYARQLLTCEALPSLLSAYPNLLTLSISAGMKPLPGPLFSSINSLSSLKRLYLTEMFQSPIPANLPVLGQLEHFTLAQYIHDPVAVLRQLGPACRELSFCWVDLNATSMRHLLQLSPHLGESVTHLVFGFIATSHEHRLEHSFNLFAVICGAFHAIESLDIMFTDHQPLTQLIPQLYKLPRLRELYLYLSPSELPSDPDFLYRLPQITSLTDLKLEVYNLSQRQFLHWVANLFPNLEALTLKIDLEEEERVAFKEVCLNETVFPSLREVTFSL